MQPEVIVVTDGDETAWRAVSTAAEALGVRTLRLSHGNPTPVDGGRLVHAVYESGASPVVVMVDDQGDPGRGAGERALGRILRDEGIHVLGVIAVASHTPHVDGVRPDVSVTAEGEVVRGAVDKDGEPAGGVLRGDTVDEIRRAGRDVFVVGLGDPGKMDGHDRVGIGVPATRAALELLLERSARNGRRRGQA
ncbi:MAG: stage V sporulation protein AE [Actinomycetia bacterium]|nr:stage V sporulation protein AE [Actinomycetes bacterium]